MKNRFTSAVAALALISQAPALAYTHASPSISLIPLAPMKVAVEHTQTGCDVPAAVDGNPYFEMPEIAAEMDAHGTADVKIDLTSSGALAHEELFSTSGNRPLDDAALLSAKLTRFTPELVDCERVAGSYLYEVQF